MSEKLIGPALPPMFRRCNDEDSEDEEESKYEGFLYLKRLMQLFTN